MIIICGPCVIQDLETTKRIACKLKSIEQKINEERIDKVKFYFKASYSKRNRSNFYSYNGVGIQKGLDILEKIKDLFNFEVTTDIHNEFEAEPASKVCSILQIPALLSKQQDLLIAAAQTGKIVNVKKGQFSAPEDMRNTVEILKMSGCSNPLLTERGTSFGYSRLINDFSGLVEMRKYAPVVFDCTHSVQIRNPGDTKAGGRPEYIIPLARAACAVGVSGLFFETHYNPKESPSDGPNMIELSEVEDFLRRVLLIHDLTQKDIILMKKDLLL